MRPSKGAYFDMEDAEASYMVYFFLVGWMQTFPFGWAYSEARTLWRSEVRTVREDVIELEAIKLAYGSNFIASKRRPSGESHTVVSDSPRDCLTDKWQCQFSRPGRPILGWTAYLWAGVVPCGRLQRAVSCFVNYGGATVHFRCPVTQLFFEMQYRSQIMVPKLHRVRGHSPRLGIANTGVNSQIHGLFSYSPRTRQTTTDRNGGNLQFLSASTFSKNSMPEGDAVL
jgi:hypothetical protein